MQTKWLTLKGKRYYFYSNSGVAACKTFLTDSKKNTRYFTSACYMLTGWTKNSSNEYRYFETEDGIMAKGFQTLDGKKYYLIYEAAEIMNWTLLGIVPADVVNASMNNLQFKTMFIIGGIVFSVAVIIIIIILKENRCDGYRRCNN